MSEALRTPTRGTILRGRIPVMGGAVSHLYGCYRVTAVRPPRFYVSYVSGHKHCSGVRGHVNQWVHVDDLGRFEVVTVGER